MKALLNRGGADIETEYNLLRMLLSWAAQRGHEFVVRMLVDGGVDIEAKSCSSQTLLSWSSESGGTRLSSNAV